MLLPGIGFTSASWVAERTMNGVPWMVSAGSNQVGTSVVCTAQVICPSGAASPGRAPSARSMTMSNETERPLTCVMVKATPHLPFSLTSSYGAENA